MRVAETRWAQQVLESGIRRMLRNPEENLTRMAHLIADHAPDPEHRRMASVVLRYLEDKESNWYQLAHRLFQQIHPNVINRMAVNFFLKANILGVPRQRQAAQELGVSVPWAILMDPTERCNLRCKGCWAGDYQRTHELGLDTMDRIVREGKELGIYFYVISGGEPTVRMDWIFELARRHPDAVFHLFTNGTLVTPEMAQQMVDLGNITMAISIDGLEETTDQRRGQGVFQKVMHTMDILREAGVVFGFSATYTRKNTEEVSSDEFIDLMIDKGAAFGWYFTYIPIGRDVDLEFMATPEQRGYMYQRLKELRRTKPIFLVDFWNDGEWARGCIAGGRKYFHINANGDVEPCAFVHYATCNIKDMSLREALQNPLFKAYQKRQPFNVNQLRPCPLIDNPEVMVEMVRESGAYFTQLTCDETPEEFAAKLAPYASRWGQKAAELRPQDELLREKEKELSLR
ncbi:MAG TPA: radical SAM protein [Symbiobacteriaceae bacterium]